MDGDAGIPCFLTGQPGRVVRPRIFTGSLEHSFRAIEELEVAGVPTWRIDHVPYCGVKDSRLGREGPRHTIEEMTELKLMVSDRP